VLLRGWRWSEGVSCQQSRQQQLYKLYFLLYRRAGLAQWLLRQLFSFEKSLLSIPPRDRTTGAVQCFFLFFNKTFLAVVASVWARFPPPPPPHATLKRVSAETFNAVQRLQQARAQTFWGAGAQSKKKGTQCQKKIRTELKHKQQYTAVLDLRLLWQHQTTSLHFLYE